MYIGMTGMTVVAAAACVCAGPGRQPSIMLLKIETNVALCVVVHSTQHRVQHTAPSICTDHSSCSICTDHSSCSIVYQPHQLMPTGMRFNHGCWSLLPWGPRSGGTTHS